MKMMVTITSMKKIQEPDLLLDQPCHLQSTPTHHIHRYTPKSLSKPSRSSPKNSHKSRRVHPSPEESSICSTTSSTNTTTTSISSPFEDTPTAPTTVIPNCGQTAVDGLEDDDEISSQWPPSPSISPQHQLQRHHHQSTHSHSNSSHLPSWVWIRTKTTKASSSPSISSSREDFPCLPRCLGLTSCSKMNSRHLIFLIIISLILLTALITFLALLLRPGSNYNSEMSSVTSNSVVSDDSEDLQSIGEEDGAEDEEVYDYDKSLENSNSNNNNNNLDLKEVSRLSWNLLNSNQERLRGNNNNNRDRESSSGSSSSGGNRNRHHPPSNLIPSSFASISGGEEVILPSKMIFTSKGNDLSEGKSLGSNPSGGETRKKSCCRTQKYSQVIRREGCEPLVISNRMCFGQCVSVWVPGLFASFPVCRPSRSSWKMVTLTCGKNREKQRRVKVEKVRRCSCMEIEPTAPSPTMES